MLAVLAGGGVAAGAGASVDDALWDFHIVPLDLEPAPPFSLPTPDGGRLALADLRGRVVMLYFWEST